MFLADKFLTAQALVIDDVLAELRAGYKQTHWMWFIFPQLTALGRSATARHFGLDGLSDAHDWLAHPVLSARLLDCTRAVLMHSDKSITAIMGSPDNVKLRSCMTLFALADPEQPLFGEVLKMFYKNKFDPLTVQIIVQKG
jgi:uncharacterized protein (DUF1810 family)